MVLCIIVLLKEREQLAVKQERVRDLEGQVKILKDEYSELYAENINYHEKRVDISTGNDWLRSMIRDAEKEICILIQIGMF